MSRTSAWWAWVQRNLDARGWTNADLARATHEQSGGSGVHESVIGRWKNRDADPSPASIRIVARVFGRDIREAAIEAGLFTAEELDAEWPDLSEADLAAKLSDDAIVDEVRRRMTPARRRPRRRVTTPTASDGEHANRTAVMVSQGGGDMTTVAVRQQTDPPSSDEDEGSGRVLNGERA